MEIKNKTKEVSSLLRTGEFEKALSIAKSFRLGFTNEQRRILQIAGDVVKGRGKFYAQLGIDIDSVVNEAMILLDSKYNKK